MRSISNELVSNKTFGLALGTAACSFVFLFALEPLFENVLVKLTILCLAEKEWDVKLIKNFTAANNEFCTVIKPRL